MDEERAKYLKIYDDYFSDEKPCPYCWAKDGDPHDEGCYMLDIVAYFDNGAPFPAQPAAPATVQPAASHDVEHEIYLAYENYRYNAVAEGANPMSFASWRGTTMGKRIIAEKYAQQPATGGGADAYATYALESFTRARKGLATIEGDTHPDYIAWLENNAFEDMLVAQDQLATLRTELVAAQARAAELERALEPFAHEWQVYQDFAAEQGGRADVGNYLTNYRDLDIIMNACERAYKARPTAGE